MTDKKTHFGYQQVDWNDKEKYVKQVFDNVAGNYDLMNDVMSFGIHRLWKQFAKNHSGLKKGDKVLDIACGSGDLSRLYKEQVGPEGLVLLSDINEEMLKVGRDRMIDAGHVQGVDYTVANAETLPFKTNYFDCISIGFGLRNVTDKAKALSSMFSVLKPGGKLLVLEFSKPTIPLLKKIYDVYSFTLLPMMGKTIANDEDSYRYLAESIRMHPNQDTLKKMCEEAGFEDCQYFNLTGGIVALHTAYKY